MVMPAWALLVPEGDVAVAVPLVVPAVVPVVVPVAVPVVVPVAVPLVVPVVGVPVVPAVPAPDVVPGLVDVPLVVAPVPAAEPVVLIADCDPCEAFTSTNSLPTPAPVPNAPPRPLPAA
jgi:hypothetical protein